MTITRVWQQTSRRGARTVAESLHLIKKCWAERDNLEYHRRSCSNKFYSQSWLLILLSSINCALRIQIYEPIVTILIQPQWPIKESLGDGSLSKEDEIITKRTSQGIHISKHAET